MKIIDILKQKSEKPTDEDNNYPRKLYNLADDLKGKAINHLKRIREILPEFDLHDEAHTECVLNNIENLLGNHINHLSVYELFLLYISAFFHDCAMAPAEWEINTMKLTEGVNDFYLSKCSIKNDLKPPLKLANAIEIIKSNKENLYVTYDKEVRKWLFTPKNEETLIKYLANLLAEYQEFRNGYGSALRKVKTLEEFAKLNHKIRTDYIRSTHHGRIEIYLKNLGNHYNSSIIDIPFLKKIFNDLALVCRAHGENNNYISNLHTDVQYADNDIINLQFIAIMLRLGDITHFCFDRAPLEIRTAQIFESEYSFQQWSVKENGVNYSINNGTISYMAYCDLPQDYFLLHKYIDQIDIELRNYNKFLYRWDKKYNIGLDLKVNRKNIRNNNENFLPIHDLKFTIDQNKIIELLIGTQLYKSDYACLRELYQNSLDACRCMQSQLKGLNIESKGEIEFGIISRNKDDRYLYCLDNGIGMTRDIVESYLLKIGNSYYQSPDFSRQRINWLNSFTPTSQFGIGLLSCFMIGDAVEIISKSLNDDYVSCYIDGPREIFYYKKTSKLDKEKIPSSGTLVKILLNEKFKNKIDNSEIKKLGLLLFGNDNLITTKYPYLQRKIKNDYLQNTYVENHLYFILNKFVQQPFKDINVFVRLSNNKKKQILKKPIIFDVNDEKLEFQQEDIDLLGVSGETKRSSIISRLSNSVTIPVVVAYKNISLTTELSLPIKEDNLEFFDHMLYSNSHDSHWHESCSLIHKEENSLLVDGILIDSSAMGFTYKYRERDEDVGVLNFTGEIRPQLSISRENVVEYPSESQLLTQNLLLLQAEQILKLASKHIKDYELHAKTNIINSIWHKILDPYSIRFEAFLKVLSTNNYGNILISELNETLGEEITINDFLNKEKIILTNYSNNYSLLVDALLKFKLNTAKTITLTDTSIEVCCNDFFIKLNKDSILSYFKTEGWNENYDIIQSLEPFISYRLFNIIDQPFLTIGRGQYCELSEIFDLKPDAIHQNKGIFSSEFNGDTFVINYEDKKNFDLNFIDDKQNNDNTHYFIYVYISGDDYILDDEKMKKIKAKDPIYYKGMSEGWSILITGMSIDNAIVYPGKCKREVLVNKISNEFWNKYNGVSFRFTDNTRVERNFSLEF